MKRLKDRVAVVTGASRNLGRGIALVLGEEGATVYVTGRSIRGEQTSDFPGANIEDVAEEVTARGGVGIAVCCDHGVDEEVKALFERVKEEQGHLEILEAAPHIVVPQKSLDGDQSFLCIERIARVQPIRQVKAVAYRVLDLGVQEQLDVVHAVGRSLAPDAADQRFPVRRYAYRQQIALGHRQNPFPVAIGATDPRGTGAEGVC